MAARRNSPSFGSLIRIGFGLGLGSAGVFILLTLVALLFFVPGYILLNREQKKPKEEQNSTNKTIGFVLMGLGVVIGLGFGAGAFLGEIGQEL